MKKMNCIIISLILCVFLIGCSENIEIKEYNGIKLTQLEYFEIDYNGGHTTEYVFDFTENVVKICNYFPYEEEKVYEVITLFTDEEERILINKLYSYGLFNIKEDYKSPSGIIDGGGWNLNIYFEDGSLKSSKGSNNVPEKVFNNCSKAFYDICGDGIVGYVEREYYLPPLIDCSVSYSIDGSNYHFGSFGAGYYQKGNYLWNGFSDFNVNPYFISESIFDNIKKQKEEFKYVQGIEYKLCLYTSNYKMYGDYPRFKRCIVRSYLFDEGLSDEKIIFSENWFSQKEFVLEENRLYVIKLTFNNGDYVEYTFNTCVTE